MAVTTAGDLIRKAYNLILVLGTQDTLTSSEMDDGLDALNMMLDSWRLERLSITSLTHVVHTLTGNVQSYTIGTGGDINTSRPTKLENAFVRYGGADYPIDIVGQVQWDLIPYKAVSGVPRRLFYDASVPLGTVNLFPMPISSAYELHMNVYAEIESFASISENFDLAPGYARAIVYNLAVESAPMFNRVPSAEVVKVARMSLQNVKRLNTQPVITQVDSALLRPSVVYDITSDGYR